MIFNEQDFLVISELTQELLAIDSPSGDTEEVTAFVAQKMQGKWPELVQSYTHKGALHVDWLIDGASPRRAVTAHVDTLGGQVSEILENGRLRFLNVGGYAYGSIEGENVRIRNDEGRVFTGTMLPDWASVHIFSDAMRERKRDYDTCSIRLDEDVTSPEDVRRLGIEIGDFVAFEPRPVVTPNGYIKARFLDNKLNVAILLRVLERMQEAGVAPAVSTRLIFSNFEEVGHGVTGLPASVQELIALDIGTVGQGRNSSEQAVTIVAKDSRTPYPLPLKRRLVKLACEHDIAYRVDTHVRYGSDGSIGAIAALDIDFSCFGPGVDATHHYERSHREGVLATCQLLEAYLSH